jgi:outer membrane protein assembly factor BamB
MKKTAVGIIVSLCVCTAIAGQSKSAVNWWQFRGPNGSGLYETTGLPLELGPDTNVVWKRPLATGYSSPILTEEFIFLTALEGEKLITFCLERETGKTLWRREAPRLREEKIDSRNHPASPSPATDGKIVVVFFPDFGLLAYDFTGKELWKLPLGPFNNLYGMGTSPIIVDEKVILVCDQNLDSFILAVDKTSGKVLWRKERPEAKSGHSTPIVYKPDGGDTEVLVPGSFLLISYSAETGERLWWVGGLSFEMKSTPVIQDGVLYINGYASPLNQPENQVKIPGFEEALASYDKDKNGMLSREELPGESVYNWVEFADLRQDGQMDEEDWNYFQAALASLNGMLAIRLGGRGDRTEENTVWQYRRSVPQLPSPLIYGEVLYMINDGGFVTTFKPSSGEVIERGRLRGGGSHFYASPVASDGKIYIISQKGIVSVLEPGGGLEVAARGDLGEDCYATPAIAEGRIYVRTVKTLYCFAVQE